MRSRGFSFVELLLVVAIVALLAAVGMPSYADLSARQRLAAASEQLAAEPLAGALFAVDISTPGLPAHLFGG